MRQPRGSSHGARSLGEALALRAGCCAPPRTAGGDLASSAAKVCQRRRWPRRMGGMGEERLRARLQTFVLALALTALGCGAPEPPLLLLITADTLRADHLGTYGSERELTPNLDALAQGSVVFDVALAPTAYTLPSLSALMTGRYPEEIATTTNWSTLPEGTLTLASVLGLHDWRTGAVVSNYVLRAKTGIDAGFDVFDDTFPQREAIRELPERVADDTTEAALRALDELRRRGGAGTFLWVHYQDPHGPYTPPDGLRERYLPEERARPDGLRELPVSKRRGLGGIPDYQYLEGQRQVAFYRAGYAGEVHFLDAQVGRLLDGLAARGLWRRAVIVFSADHGEALGEDDYWFAHGEHLTAPSVQIPLFVRAPGVSPARRADPASLVDLFPTLLGLAGVTPPPGQRGRDLLAVGAEHDETVIYVATLTATPVSRYGLAADGFKYLAHHEREGLREELFRLGEEPRDLAEEHPERVRAMRERLAELRAELGVQTRRERRQILSAEEREMLRRLGYVEE
jgi:arylsulfatase A-like enzyme